MTPSEWGETAEVLVLLGYQGDCHRGSVAPALPGDIHGKRVTVRADAPSAVTAQGPDGIHGNIVPVDGVVAAATQEIFPVVQAVVGGGAVAQVDRRGDTALRWTRSL